MHSAVVFGGLGLAGTFGTADLFPTGVVDDIEIHAGVVAVRAPDFEPSNPKYYESVLVRTRAFSCNFRDKSFIQQTHTFPKTRFSPVGSEFVGEVVAVGDGVRTLSVGDRVLTNHHYTGGLISEAGVVEGVATNKASRSHHILHASKLLRVPDAMDDTVAAAFSLNAQTAYSMVRKTEVQAGHNVLITSGTSNVGLFLIPRLRALGANIYVTTSRAECVPTLEAMGVSKAIVLDRSQGFMQSQQVVDLAIDIGFFDRIYDPFFDLHIRRSADILRHMGVYCTCGVLRQGLVSTEGLPVDEDFGMEVLAKVMIRNLTIMGNCVGLTCDLEQALADYAAGTYDIVIDSCYSEGEFAPFLSRTFSEPDRFGKVVYQF